MAIVIAYPMSMSRGCMNLHLKSIRSFGAALIISAAALLPAALLSASQVQAQASGCQEDFQKNMAPRQALINRINGFRAKRPTAGQACSTLGQLVAADSRMITWMNANKDWYPHSKLRLASGAPLVQPLKSKVDWLALPSER